MHWLEMHWPETNWPETKPLGQIMLSIRKSEPQGLLELTIEDQARAGRFTKNPQPNLAGDCVGAEH
jgi:hypothetical protein